MDDTKLTQININIYAQRLGLPGKPQLQLGFPLRKTDSKRKKNIGLSRLNKKKKRKTINRKNN